MTTLAHADHFFAMSRERYKIKLKRDAGDPWPWTENKVFQEWRFTNVFREDDKTTTWFRNNVRQPLVDQFEYEADRTSDSAKRLLVKIVESTMIFRAFNRITTAGIIQDLLLDTWDSKEARERLQDVQPLVTGAYMLKYESGLSKLDGVLSFIDEARPHLPRMVPRWGRTLEGAWSDLKSIRYLGGFTAHEIVQDLRYTPVLHNATDVMSWGHLGPGATRGMSWVVYGNELSFGGSAGQQREMLKLMRELLELSKQEEHWPSAWPKWELHQVEFGLCEYSKFCKASNGIPQKRRYQLCE